MSLFWRKNPDLKNVDLPQTIMQPFWHPDAQQLDDHKFCTQLPDAKPLIRLYAILTLALMALTISALAICEIMNSAQYNQLLEQFINKPLANQPHTIALTGLLAIPLLYIFIKAYPARVICFDRKENRLYYPGNCLIPRIRIINYNDFQGKIYHLKSLFGKRKTRLILMHKTSHEIICLANTFSSPQALTGYWSFIEQYMNPGAPLPDVPAPHDYPDTTPGIIRQHSTNYSL
ncbi:MAG: hypothetical protein OQL09_04735 [Gammaproteobacteria bacterium]|nr:hypothetical protein [Gammaproteobacteria bacterium]